MLPISLRYDSSLPTGQAGQAGLAPRDAARYPDEIDDSFCIFRQDLQDLTDILSPFIPLGRKPYGPEAGKAENKVSS